MNLSDLQRDTLYYVASPYTKYPQGNWSAYKQVSRIAGLLVASGLQVYCPIAHSHPLAIYANIDLLDHEFWMRVDAPFCRLCGALIVVRMDGWDASKGVTEEIKIFQGAKKPVWFLEPSTMEVSDVS